jgi:hypothetical protein
MSADLERVNQTRVPDSSIVGITPNIEDIPLDVIEQYKKNKQRIHASSEKVKHCCICGEIPSKIVRYSIQGAQVVEHYCDSCAEKRFSRSS